MTGRPVSKSHRVPRRLRALPTTLAALSGELRALAALSESLQTPIADLIAQIGSHAAADYGDLQGADVLTQTLGDLAAFCAALAEGVAGESPIDPAILARGLQLSDLAARLGCGEGRPGSGGVSGLCEFFGD